MNTTLITGANGEIGHSLLETLSSQPDRKIIALDLAPLGEALAKHVHVQVQGDVSDPSVVAQLEQHDIDEIYHLAALLSTSSEKNPERAHNVNVNGTMGLLMMARRIGTRTGKAVKFLFPSTIAVYGMKSIEEKNNAGAVTEFEHLQPTTMYGINKVYCEQLGAYMSDRFGQLTDERGTKVLDFRALRFPGLISATTVPTGGTSDYAPEMIHAAAQGKAYACFVRPDARIPFMAMPDGVKALLDLAATPMENLTQRVYNIGAFSPSAEEIAVKVKSAFPSAEITYAPHPQRQAIVDSWCGDVNDSAARNDWGWTPDYDMDRAFNEYLIPIISKVYAG
jgi:nucleoside-diphosphate-sugar epimerase